MARLELVVTLTRVHSFEVPCYGAPWKDETKHIYSMTDENGNVYVWKTTSSLGKYVTVHDPKCAELDREVWDGAHKGDKLRITGTIKGIKHWNGIEETELTRVKMVEKLFDAEEARRKAAAEKAAAEKAKKEALLASISDGDEIITMTYARFKAHYADCETIPDSYKANVDSRGFRLDDPTIDVVVRAGRMKASGTRGKNFRRWIMEFDVDGSPTRKAVYAICPENAEKRVRKEFPGATGIVCTGVCRESARYID